jgi:hypothetical protein
MSSEERSSIDNGIWMCRTHGEMVDNDEKTYPVALLKQWKSAAEARARDRLGVMQMTTSPRGSTWIGSTAEALSERTRNYDLSSLFASQKARPTGGRDLTSIAAPLIAPPLAPVCAIDRSAVVEELLRDDSVVWLGLHGTHGTGKTQLARELAVRVARKTVWIRLRDMAATDLVSRVLSAIESAAVADRLAETLIVLDDLPDLGNADATAEYLLRLCQISDGARPRLLSTSNFRIPSGILESEAGHLVAEVPVPPLSDAEVDLLLTRFEAPSIDRAALSAIVLAFSDGHPQIAVALCTFLKNGGWAVNEAVLEELMGGRHFSTLQDEVVKRLIGTVPDDGRRLLYRLNLAAGSFQLTTAQRIAAVDPPIHLPREKIVQLTGPWLQRETADEFSLSPLLRVLPGDLSDGERRACHSVFASVLLKGNIDQIKVVTIIGHLVQAGKPAKAAALLLEGLIQLIMSRENTPDVGLTEIWASAALPAGVPMYLRIQLRAAQLAVRARRGCDVSIVEDDLAALLSKVTLPDSWSILAIGPLVFHVLFRVRPAIATSIFQAVQRSWSVAKLPDGRDPREFFPFPCGTLLEIVAADVQNAEQAGLWLDCVESISPDSRTNWREVEEGGSLVCARVFLGAHDSPPEQRNWQGVEQFLLRMAASARRMHLRYMWAAAEAILLSTRGEYLDRRSEGVLAAVEALRLIDDGGARFVIRESLARQMALVGDWGRVREILDIGFLELGEASSEPAIIVGARTLAARAWLALDPRRALVHANSAVEVARSSEFRPPELARVLGDAAITAGRADDRLVAFDLCREAVSLLLTNWDASDRRCHTVFTGITEILKRLARPHTFDDLEPGWFREIQIEVVGEITAKKRAGAILLLVDAASRLGRQDVAYEWAEYAWNLGLSQSDGTMNVLSLAVVPAVFRMDFAKVLAGLGKITNLTREDLRGTNPNEAAREEAVLGLLWSPLVWRIAEAWSRGEKVQELAAKFAQVARTIPDQVAAPPFWGELGSVLDMFAADGIVPVERVRAQNNLKRAVLTAQLALLCSLQDGLSPRDAAHLHMVALAYYACVDWAEDAASGVVLAFVRAYWTRRVREERYQFSAVRFLEAELDAPSGKTSIEKAASILKEAAGTLRVSLFPDFALRLPSDTTRTTGC